MYQVINRFLVASDNFSGQDTGTELADVAMMGSLHTSVLTCRLQHDPSSSTSKPNLFSLSISALLTFGIAGPLDLEMHTLLGTPAMQTAEILPCCLSPTPMRRKYLITIFSRRGSSQLAASSTCSPASSLLCLLLFMATDKLWSFSPTHFT